MYGEREEVIVREMTLEQAERHNARVRAGRKGLPAAVPCPPPVLKLRPRASVMAVGRTARGVMNKTEARYASEVLDVRKATGEVAEYWYESVKLRLAEGAWFTVDFFVMLADGRLEAHEVKGFLRESAAVRIKTAAEKYPFLFFMAFKRKKVDGGGWKIKEI
jgi:hypothetical protein